MILETPRLTLREMSRDDLDFVAEMLGSARVMEWYPRPLNRADSLAWVDRQIERYAEHGHGFWLAIEKSTGRPIGQIGATMCDVDGVNERALGWIIHDKFWRRGFATEGAAAVRDWCFANFDTDYAFTVIRPENEPSAGVAGKIGMSIARRTTYAGYMHDVWTVSRACERR